MRNHVWDATFLVAALIVCGLCGYIIYLLNKRERYTRERFAFIGLSTASVSFTALISEIAGKTTPWQVIAGLIALLRNKQPPAPDPPHIADHLIMALIWFGLIYVITQIYKGWDGAISERQYENQRLHRPASIAADGIMEAKRILLRQEPLSRHIPEERPQEGLALLSDRQPLAWHLQARDLLYLRNPSLDIQPSGWMQKRRCWIGRDRASSSLVFAMCETEEPPQDRVAEFLNYVQDYLNRATPPQSGADLYILVQEGNSKHRPISTTRGLRVSTLSESDLLDGLVDFSDYFSALKRRVEEIPLPDSSIKIVQTYTPTMFRAEDNLTTGDTQAYISAWLGENTQRQLALLGEYGQGKSTTALMIAYRMLGDTKNGGRVPILLELRGKSPKNMTIEELLAGWAYPYSINPQSVMKLHEKGRIFLILEGFDEVAQVGDADSRLAHFRTLWDFAGRQAKILITGRPNFFLDDKEMKRALGISATTATGPYCEALHLRPFDLDQIQDALRWCKPWVREEILKLAAEDHKFRDLVARGSLLYVVSQLWEKHLSKYKGVLNSATVIGLFLDSTYKRQSEKRKGTPDFMLLGEHERSYFTMGIASYMASHRLPNQIDRKDFRAAITALYERIPESASSAKTGFDGFPQKPLKQRLASEEDPISCVENDVRSSSVLVMDHTKSGALRFAHKSFMELSAALGFKDYLAEDGDECAGAIAASSGIRSFTILGSDEMTAFFAELIEADLPSDAKDLSQFLYSYIVLSPINKVRVPGFLAVPLIAMTVYSGQAMVRQLKRSIAFTPRLAARLLETWSPLFIPLVLTIPFMVLISIGEIVAHFTGGRTSIELTYNQRLAVGILPAAIMFSQYFLVRWLVRGGAQTSIQLWLASCEALGLRPEDISIPGQPRSALLCRLAARERDTRTQVAIRDIRSLDKVN